LPTASRPAANRTRKPEITNEDFFLYPNIEPPKKIYELLLKGNPVPPDVAGRRCLPDREASRQPSMGKTMPLDFAISIKNTDERKPGQYTNG
jgi:hypothetical protein